MPEPELLVPVSEVQPEPPSGLTAVGRAWPVVGTVTVGFFLLGSIFGAERRPMFLGLLIAAAIWLAVAWVVRPVLTRKNEQR